MMLFLAASLFAAALLLAVGTIAATTISALPRVRAVIAGRQSAAPFHPVRVSRRFPAAVMVTRRPLAPGQVSRAVLRAA